MPVNPAAVPTRPLLARIRLALLRFLAFGVVSGLGWLMDFMIYWFLVGLGLRPGFANAAGAAVAITFVYLTSIRRIFRDPDHTGMLWAKFIVYIVYQVCIVAFFSTVVDLLVHVGQLDPLWAKVLATPFNFLCNFLFMSWLTHRRWSGMDKDRPSSDSHPPAG